MPHIPAYHGFVRLVHRELRSIEREAGVPRNTRRALGLSALLAWARELAGHTHPELVAFFAREQPPTIQDLLDFAARCRVTRNFTVYRCIVRSIGRFPLLYVGSGTSPDGGGELRISYHRTDVRWLEVFGGG